MVCHSLPPPPPPCAPCEPFPCPAAANRARRFCSITEDTQRGSWRRGWCLARMLRDVPEKAKPELFVVRNCQCLKHTTTPIQSYLDILYILGSRKTLMRSAGFNAVPRSFLFMTSLCTSTAVSTSGESSDLFTCSYGTGSMPGLFGTRI